MSGAASSTTWIHQLRDRNSLAAQKLWEGYFRRLVGLARGRLRTMPRRGADEEDIASVPSTASFAASSGKVPQANDRDDLWQALLSLTEPRAFDLVEHEGRKADWRRNQSADALLGYRDLVGREPDPAFAAEVAEECEKLLDKLADSDLRLIAVRKMEGYTNREIAAELGCSLVTVERRLRLIRLEWEGHNSDE